MGHGLVRKVLVLRPGLDVSNRAALVLVRMAYSALDKPSGEWAAQVYFAGWDVLAMALGFDDPRTSAAQRAVGRAIRELTDQGLIKRLDAPAGKHQHAVYELHIDG